MLSTTIFVLVVVVLGLGIIIVATSKESEATSVFAMMVLIIGVVIFGFAILNEEDKSEVVSKGKYYVTQCELIETNIDEGVIIKDTHKLKCGDLIENVTVDEYQQAIQAYQGDSD